MRNECEQKLKNDSVSGGAASSSVPYQLDRTNSDEDYDRTPLPQHDHHHHHHHHHQHHQHLHAAVNAISEEEEECQTDTSASARCTDSTNQNKEAAHQHECSDCGRTFTAAATATTAAPSTHSRCTCTTKAPTTTYVNTCSTNAPDHSHGGECTCAARTPRHLHSHCGYHGFHQQCSTTRMPAGNTADPGYDCPCHRPLRCSSDHSKVNTAPRNRLQSNFMSTTAPPPTIGNTTKLPSSTSTTTRYSFASSTAKPLSTTSKPPTNSRLTSSNTTTPPAEYNFAFPKIVGDPTDTTNLAGNPAAEPKPTTTTSKPTTTKTAAATTTTTTTTAKPALPPLSTTQDKISSDDKKENWNKSPRVKVKQTATSRLRYEYWFADCGQKKVKAFRGDWNQFPSKLKKDWSVYETYYKYRRTPRPRIGSLVRKFIRGEVKVDTPTDQKSQKADARGRPFSLRSPVHSRHHDLPAHHPSTNQTKSSSETDSESNYSTRSESASASRSGSSSDRRFSDSPRRARDGACAYVNCEELTECCSDDHPHRHSGRKRLSSIIEDAESSPFRATLHRRARSSHDRSASERFRSRDLFVRRRSGSTAVRNRSSYGNRFGGTTGGRRIRGAGAANGSDDQAVRDNETSRRRRDLDTESCPKSPPFKFFGRPAHRPPSHSKRFHQPRSGVGSRKRARSNNNRRRSRASSSIYRDFMVATRKGVVNQPARRRLRRNPSLGKVLVNKRSLTWQQLFDEMERKNRKVRYDSEGGFLDHHRQQQQQRELILSRDDTATIPIRTHRKLPRWFPSLEKIYSPAKWLKPPSIPIHSNLTSDIRQMLNENSYF